MARSRALIIGGSLGGLFAAHMLRIAGLDVEVYERSGDDLASRGAGIGTHDEMLEVVRRIGIPVDGAMGVNVRDRIIRYMILQDEVVLERRTQRRQGE